MSRSRGRDGLTLVEVAIAIVLLGVGALALAGGIAAAEASRHRALRADLALAVAEGWLERWRAGAWWAGPDAGEEPVPLGARAIGRLAWSVEPRGPCLVEARVEVDPGPGAAVVLATRRFREGTVECGG